MNLQFEHPLQPQETALDQSRLANRGVDSVLFTFTVRGDRNSVRYSDHCMIVELL